jgi:hypothetical protein
VAKGCALLAAMVSPNFRVREFEIMEKTPYGITMTWPAKDSAVLLKMNQKKKKKSKRG